MAKASGVETLKNDRKFVYSIGEDLAGAPEIVLPEEISLLPDWLLSALHFSLKTAARNATAGLLKDKPEEAAKRVHQRFESWLKGQWRAASEAAGEPRTSLLARAVAEVLGISVEDAAEEISKAIDDALEAKGLSRDEEGDKKEVASVSANIRAALKMDSAVASVFARLQAEEAAKRAEEKAKASTSAEAKSVIGSILKR